MTDRRLRDASELADLAYDENGLIPVVTQDGDDGRVLMVAWANRQALARSLETGELHFWSRSRNTLWRKGETSGNTLALRSLHADCDGDTVLALVRPAGPACHTGEPTCFGAESAPAGSDILDRLAAVIRERARTRPRDSYTTRLLEDENLRLKKLGEETAELILALARPSGEGAAQEAADLLFHLLVALEGVGLGLDDVREELTRRRQG